MKSIATFLILSVSYFSFGQDSPDKIYEHALFEITVNGKEAHTCTIDHHTSLSSDEMVEIEQNYLNKEGVFKVSFNEQTIDVFFFDPVNYEIIQDLAQLYFGEYLVSKPKLLKRSDSGLEVSDSE